MRLTKWIDGYLCIDNAKQDDIIKKLADYEDAEEQGLLVRLPKNFNLTAAKKKTECNALVNDLIISMSPYANDDRLFKAVDAIRVFVAKQNEFIDSLTREEAEAALRGE